MSISPAVGGLNDHLEALVSRWRDEATVPLSTLFETLGLDYVGPVDGHDMDQLLATLREAKTRNRPHVIHVVTRKGKGYRLAELEPVAYHGPSPFKPETGLVRQRGGKLTYSQVFGQRLCDAAARDKRIFGITPAMSEGSCLTGFERRYPDRYIDVGIAEQHAVTLAAACAERIAAEGWAVRMLRHGLPDSFVPHGDREELLRLNDHLVPQVWVTRCKE